MKQIKTEVKYHSDKRPAITAFVLPVCQGVWHVHVDFYERFCVEGYGGGDDTSSEIIYFSYPDSNNIDFEVKLYFPSSGFLFGAVSKKTYHGTFYTHSKYEEIFEKNMERYLIWRDI